MKIKLCNPLNNAFIEQQRQCHLDHIFRQKELEKKQINDPFDIKIKLKISFILGVILKFYI